MTTPLNPQNGEKSIAVEEFLRYLPDATFIKLIGMPTDEVESGLIGTWEAKHIRELLTNLESKLREEERKRKIEQDYGFTELVKMSETMLDKVCPIDLFNTLSGDTGTVFVTKLRDALSSLSQPTVSEMI